MHIKKQGATAMHKQLGWTATAWGKVARLTRLAPLFVFSIWALSACSGKGPADLSWQIHFTCPSDADLTQSIRTRVLKDGCGGSDAVYDATLTRDEQGPAKVLPPGKYALEVTALDDAGMAVAADCETQTLPAKHVELWLASASCESQLPLDAASGDADEPNLPDAATSADARVCPAAGCHPNCAVDPGDCACTTFGAHTYLFCPDPKTWVDARAACRAKGSDLVIIESAEENAFVLSKSTGMTRWIGADDRGDDGKGTGLGADCDATCRAPVGAQEGRWTWVNAISGDEHGTPFCAVSSSDATCAASGGAYENWAPNQPDNAHTDKCLYPADPCAEGEDCGALSGSDGTWSDDTCSSKLPYVCETY
jgi:hypothetical protein